MSAHVTGGGPAFTTPVVVAAADARVDLPARTWLTMYVRTLAIQASWNYEILLGNGVGFCVEPALRHLEGGQGGEAYRRALSRQSQYFNAHPYLASLAVGALARAELEQAPEARIVRFRTALCGPLGSVGDRLVWAGWLPFCSVVALAGFGLGLGSKATILCFLVLYNVGHLGLRLWGLRRGFQLGLRVASALAHSVLRDGPRYIARATALAAGVALPLALYRIIGPGSAGPGRTLTLEVMGAAVVGAMLLRRLHARIEGWRLVLYALAAFVLYSVARHG